MWTNGTTSTNCDFNPRSPRGERRYSHWQCHQTVYISIHAPLAGSDRRQVMAADFIVISIHAPLAGSDSAWLTSLFVGFVFQSTLPSRGATRLPVSLLPTVPNFNPRSPRGERHAEEQSYIPDIMISIHAPLAGSDFDPTTLDANTTYISIHAPLAGSDRGDTQIIHDDEKFQSTLPSRGATQRGFFPLWIPL